MLASGHPSSPDAHRVDVLAILAPWRRHAGWGTPLLGGRSRGSARASTSGGDHRCTGWGAPHCTEEAGELSPVDPAEGKGRRVMEPLGGKMPGTSSPISVTTKLERIANQSSRTATTSTRRGSDWEWCSRCDDLCLRCSRKGPRKRSDCSVPVILGHALHFPRGRAGFS